MSYINRNRARQTGTNRTTQAEISNRVRHSFPGRVTGRNFQSRAAQFSGAGQIRENSSYKWLRKTGQVKVTFEGKTMAVKLLDGFWVDGGM